ncbi:hypothetical protein PSPO01_05700 [Paraphaeosphaeria sporulosa]
MATLTKPCEDPRSPTSISRLLSNDSESSTYDLKCRWPSELDDHVQYLFRDLQEQLRQGPLAKRFVTRSDPAREALKGRWSNQVRTDFETKLYISKLTGPELRPQRCNLGGRERVMFSIPLVQKKNVTAEETDFFPVMQPLLIVAIASSNRVGMIVHLVSALAVSDRSREPKEDSVHGLGPLKCPCRLAFPRDMHRRSRNCTVMGPTPAVDKAPAAKPPCPDVETTVSPPRAACLSDKSAP